jgi:hypothetical protein
LKTYITEIVEVIYTVEVAVSISKFSQKIACFLCPFNGFDELGAGTPVYTVHSSST